MVGLIYISPMRLDDLDGDGGKDCNPSRRSPLVLPAALSRVSSYQLLMSGNSYCMRMDTENWMQRMRHRLAM